jgi:hypothetical protein
MPHRVSATTLHFCAFMLVLVGFLIPPMLESGAVPCGTSASVTTRESAIPGGPATTSPARADADCIQQRSELALAKHPWIPITAVLLAIGLMVVGVMRGGLRSLLIIPALLIRRDPDDRFWNPHAYERDCALVDALTDAANSKGRAASSEAGDAIVAAALARSAATAAAHRNAPGTDADTAAALPTLRLHRMGRADPDGTAGWWIDVPPDAGELLVRTQATPSMPVTLHVAVDGAWIASAGPAELAMHRSPLPAGQVWMLARVHVEPGMTPPLLELWVQTTRAADTGSAAA